MNLSRSRFPVSCSLLGVALVVLLGGCIVPGNVGDDPNSDGGDGADTTTGAAETGSPGHTSAQPTAGSSVTATTFATASEDGGGPFDDPEQALEACGVPIVEAVDTEPEYYEFVECAEGCIVDAWSAEPINLFEYGNCLCEMLDCGPLVGGGGTGPAPGTGSETATSTAGTDTDEPPDGCGPFPPGMEAFTCSCEMCSIDVTNVDAAWLENDADLEGICECMCGNTGCGMPL